MRRGRRIGACSEGRGALIVEPVFEFEADLYLWKPDAAWVFATVPVDISDEILDIVPERRGFGSVRVGVRIGSTSWRTSVFPDSGRGCFVLPVKKQVRRAEEVDVGDPVEIELTVLLD